MKSINIKTPAKLNLYLNILGLRIDNYHDIETIFQAISLYDDLEVSCQPSEESRIKIITNVDDIPTDINNIAYEAAEKYLERVNKTAEVVIKINKKIPVAAGLAGGSTNAAGVLKALNALHDNLLSKGELIELASTLGADIGFFLTGGTAYGTGIGDILKSIKTPDLSFILIKPTDISIGSGWAYKEYDLNPTYTYEDKIEAILHSISMNNKEELASLFYNSLERGVLKHFPILQELKETLLSLGCYNALMSGSGPTVFGLLKSKKQGHIIQGLLTKDSFESFIVDAIPAESLVIN